MFLPPRATFPTAPNQQTDYPRAFQWINSNSIKTCPRVETIITSTYLLALSKRWLMTLSELWLNCLGKYRKRPEGGERKAKQLTIPVLSLLSIPGEGFDNRTNDDPTIPDTERGKYKSPFVFSTVNPIQHNKVILSDSNMKRNFPPLSKWAKSRGMEKNGLKQEGRISESKGIPWVALSGKECWEFSDRWWCRRKR